MAIKVYAEKNMFSGMIVIAIMAMLDVGCIVQIFKSLGAKDWLGISIGFFGIFVPATAILAAIVLTRIKYRVELSESTLSVQGLFGERLIEYADVARIQSESNNWGHYLSLDLKSGRRAIIFGVFLEEDDLVKELTARAGLTDGSPT